MKNRLNTSSTLKYAAIAAYLFTHMATAATARQLDSSAAPDSHATPIAEEIKSGFADMLADMGFPEVKHQVKKLLKHNATELQASELVNAGTQQLPEYKFKVLITD